MDHVLIINEFTNLQLFFFHMLISNKLSENKAEMQWSISMQMTNY